MEALQRLKYSFNADLQLRHIDTGEPFKFIDQNHYEELADAVAEYIQEVMVKDYDMIRIKLPYPEHLGDILEGDDEDILASVHCPIFASSNYKEVDVVLLLLCGTGRVAAGQWARKLCINDSLHTGSVLPFLEWARKYSFGVIVLNPNKTFVDREEGHFRIPYNESAEAHVNYVWKMVCKGLPAKHFILVAHSYGGVSTLNILKHHGDEVLERLRSIAFTDSAHSTLCSEMLSNEAKEFLARRSINWASSRKPLDTIIELPSMPKKKKKNKNNKNNNKNNKNHKNKKACNGSWYAAQEALCKVISAGTDVHELTTMSAFPSICKFLLDSLRPFDVDLGIDAETSGGRRSGAHG